MKSSFFAFPVTCKQVAGAILFASLASLPSLPLAAGTGASADDAITISQSDIVTTSSYYSYNTYPEDSPCYILNGGKYYANSGDLNFGTTDDRNSLCVGFRAADNYFTFSSGTGTSYCLDVGYYSGSSGTMTIDGTSASWGVAANIKVGVNETATGTLNVTNGGKITTVSGGSSSMIVGMVGTGTVNVSGNGSSITVDNAFYAGMTGSGTVTISDHGNITASDSSSTGSIIGYGSNNNKMTVTGGATLICGGSLYVGYTVSDTTTGNVLEIDDGALVKVGDVSGETLTIVTGNYVNLGSGYLALYGDQTDYLSTLLSGIRVYDSASGKWVSATSADVTATYVTAALASSVYSETGYSLEGYTLIELASAVPEPATYALFGGLGALGLVLLRRKRR